MPKGRTLLLASLKLCGLWNKRINQLINLLQYLKFLKRQMYGMELTYWNVGVQSRRVPRPRYMVALGEQWVSVDNVIDS